MLLCPALLYAAPPRMLDDAELARVDARDGIGFAAHIVVNDPNLAGAVSDSRLSLGFHDGGTSRYIVLRNVRGTIDMFALGIDVAYVSTHHVVRIFLIVTLAPAAFRLLARRKPPAPPHG